MDVFEKHKRKVAQMRRRTPDAIQNYLDVLSRPSRDFTPKTCVIMLVLMVLDWRSRMKEVLVNVDE